MASYHHITNLFVPDGAKHLDAVLEDVMLDHLLKVDSFGAGARDDELSAGVVVKDARNRSCKKIDAFVREETRYDNDGDGVMWPEGIP